MIIDEFQYLVLVNRAFPSIFQRIWDEILKDRQIMVIICGSLIGMMKDYALSYSSPLYGRRTAQIKLQAFKFNELRDHFLNKSFTEMVDFYALTAGIPKYFEFFDNKKSLMKNIEDNVLSRSGFLYEEPIFLLEKEVREKITYFSIIKTIATGRHRLNEISSFLGLKSNALSPYLNTLINLDILEKKVPVTEKYPEKSRKGLYFIRDSFIRFWFVFVYPFKGELELDNTKTVLEKLDQNYIDNYLSYVFEDICRDSLAMLCRNRKINFNPSKIGAFWNYKDIEIDVVAIDNSGKKLFAGESKYHLRKPVSIEVYYDLLKKCSNPEFQYYELYYGLFSRSGFDEKLIKLAASTENLYLINENEII